MRSVLSCLMWGVLLTSTALGGEVGFVEDFALARDRLVPLRQLIPGTEDYYYYHALHLLNTRQYDKVEGLTRPWHERFGQTARLTEIQTRHALLGYERNPERSLAYLRQRLGLQFHHQKEVIGTAPNLPTALDPNLISRATLRASSLARWTNLDNFEDSALDWLASEELTWERRRHLLQRMSRPDVATLPRLVAEDLRAPHAQDFGAFGIHRQMTVAQLEELLRLRPDLLNHTALVQAYLTKLQPGADEDWRRDRTRTLAHLERLQSFADRLAPVHNPLKAHVLYHRLALDRAQGVFDRGRFLAYLRLPRQQAYMAKELLEREDSRRFPADLNADFTPLTLLPRVGSDEPLVRSYLAQFLLKAESTREFEPFINDVYLRHLFAEVRITRGIGEPEEWASQLPPELFRQLKDRIDIEFAPTNKTDFAADEPVRLDLAIKNVPTLLVKIFEINTLNFYRSHQREVDTDVNLDGLVANAEQTQTYTESAFRRMDRHFEFPTLNRPGVYVIDFIGAGKSSRALIRKGRLRPLVTTGTAGHVVTVVDEKNQRVADAALWLGGQEYHAQKDGTILVPFSTNPGQRPIVLRKGEFASLDTLRHHAESFQLTAGLHVDREALLTQRIASVLVRPGLLLNGTPVSVGLLEEARLQITSVDHDGIATSTEVPNFKLFEDRESIHELRVPARLARLTIALRARVKNLSQAKTVDLEASETFVLNEIERSDKIEDLHLARFGPDHVLELRGRTGEAKPDRPVLITLKHRDFREVVQATLKTDAQGRVRLGRLAEIVSVTASGPEGPGQTWALSGDRHTYRQAYHAAAGEVATLPYLGSADRPTREELALFEMRANVIQADRFDSLSIRNGLIELRGLTPGDYDLWLKRSGERVRVRIVDGPREGRHLLGKVRHLEFPALKPVQIASLTTDDEHLTVRLQDASRFARIHLFATRYQPAYSPYANLSRVRAAELGGVYPASAESVYLTGRNIGDEYRYVLDRRGQKHFPGNMLERPMLLLNPWAVRSTETTEQLAKGGDDFSPKGEIAPAKPMAPPAPSESAAQPSVPGAFANLDFLADASAVLVNLVPDKDGVLRIPRKQLGPHAMIHVVAVDPLATTARSLSLPEQPAAVVDLRLRRGFDPQAHFTQQKQISILAAGQPFVLDDLAGSRFDAYDSLARLHGLYSTLTRDPKLLEFAFLLTWPTKKPEEKRSLYSRHACHELNFFLAQKDAEFFRTVIRPSLANKKDKTFLDHWLLGDDLNAYRQPWAYGRLNAVERVLLARRIDGEPTRTARHFDDLLRLQPPRTDRFLVLFNTAVQGRALDTSAPVGERRLEELKNITKTQTKVLTEMPQSAAGAAPGAPNGATPNYQRPANQPANGKLGAEYRSKNGRSGEEAEKQRQMLGRGALPREEADRFFDDSRAGFGVRPLFRHLDPTQEWAENNYHRLLVAQQVASLVNVSAFWLDYARHDGKSPFLSRHLADPTHNFTEMMFALAVLDLPFESGKSQVTVEAGRMTLKPAGPVVIFHEEVRPAQAAAAPLPILVSQNFYRHGDRFRDENGEKVDKFVTGEFLIHTVYGGQVVVTNPTSSRQKLTVLVQLPVGAIPVANGQFTRSVLVDLEPYRTQTIDYLFYFPLPGRFAQFPVHVARNEQFVAAAQPATFPVVEKPSRLDTASWDYVSQNGNNDEVLAFLRRENVQALNLEKIAFRMRDRAFFEAVLTLLHERHLYQPTLWSYGIHHADETRARQYLTHADALVAECGGPLVSPLLTIDPVARHQYEHLEYRPLVNARAHALGEKRQIVNGRLHEQYHRFLKTLSYRPELDDTDRLAVTYYLLVQDRIAEALATFAEVQPERVTTRLQYDICAAYLALFGDEPQRARAIAARYLDHPVDRWRNTFTVVLHTLDEAEGKSGKMADAEDRTQRQGQLASTEPSFEFTLDSRAIQLTWQNLETVRVNYYLMDVELLFSRNPFVQQVSGSFASIRPNATQEVKLPAGQSRLAVALPDNLVRRNVLVEVTAAGKTLALPYYANAMDLRLMEGYGQVRVTETAGGKPLPKVYVKVYARLANGQVKFHKDGYTDIRGRFDYASISTPEESPVTRYAILTLSEERGAQIREAAPPVR